jgi:hypothetical protein
MDPKYHCAAVKKYLSTALLLALLTIGYAAIGHAQEPLPWETRFLENQFKTNTGILLMSLMVSVGREQQYFDGNPTDANVVPHCRPSALVGQNGLIA